MTSAPVAPPRSADPGADRDAPSIALLGPLEVRLGGVEIAISGNLVRQLLLRLAVDAPHPVSAGGLIDAVWGAEPPEEPVNALQSLVSRLRRALAAGYPVDSAGPDRRGAAAPPGAAGGSSAPGGAGGPATIVAGSAGYRLNLPGLDVDSERFGRLAARGHTELRDGDLTGSAQTLRGALGLWRGEALADAGEADWARSTRRALDAQRVDALLDRIDADAALGRHAPLAGELAALDLGHPLDERFAGRLIDALAAAGRTAAALETYERFRVRVADALGSDPSPAMQARHLALLRGDTPSVTTGRPVPADAERPAAGGALPLPITTFVGRDDDLAAVRGLLAAGRLVTIVGTGGCGKTRLATEVAATAGPGVPADVRLVHLAPVTDGAEIPAVVLSAVLSGGGEYESRAVDRRGTRRPVDPTQRIVEILAKRDSLLLLDNCEHLLAPVAELTDRLLSTCPGLRILTTSREPLALTGESLWPLAPLAVPPAPDRPPHASGRVAAPPVQEPAAIARYDGVRLFCDRARAVRPSFALDATTVGDVAQIVRRLDGLPLAIELAAARLRTLPLAQIAAGLSDRFRLLTGGSRTALPRHRTLKAVVEWSWDLLSERERAVAEAASVFSAGVTAASAHAVRADAGDEDEIADILGSLVDKCVLSLVDGLVPRYRMLETLREFGIERLSAQGGLAAAYDAHARFFAGLAARSEPELRTAGQLPWVRGLVEERENLAAAIRHLAGSDAATAVTMVTRLAWFWIIADWHADGHAAMTAVLDAVDALDAAATPDPGGGLDSPGPAGAREPGSDAATARRRAADPLEVLCLRALSALNSGAPGGPGRAEDQPGMRRQLIALDDEFEALVQDPGAPDVRLRGLSSLVRTLLAAFGGEPQRRRRALDSVLTVPIPWVRGVGHVLIAATAENDGDLPVLREQARLGLAVLRPIGERWGLYGALRLVAQAAVYDGDLPGAAAAYTEALRHSAELSAEFGTADEDVFIRLQLARVLQRLGDVDGALAHARAATSNPAAALPDLRGIASDALLMQVLESAGRTEEVREVRARIAVKLADRPAASGPFGGHETALALSVGAGIDVDEGRPDEAAARLAEAVEAAIGTGDRPVMAAVAIAVARLAQARTDAALAARLVGAAAFLRGSPDDTDPDLISLVRRLRDSLGVAEVDRLTAFDGDRDAALDLLRSAVQPPAAATTAPAAPR